MAFPLEVAGVTAVLGVACGLIFVAWNQVGFMTASPRLPEQVRVTVTGVWLLGNARRLHHPQAWFRALCRAGGRHRHMGLGSLWASETLYSGHCTGHRC